MAGMSKSQQHQQKANEARRKAYRSNDQRAFNKALSLKRHLRRFPWDAGAIEALKRIAVGTLKRAGINTIPSPAASPVQLRARDGLTLTKVQRAKASRAGDLLAAA